ncbi:MAG TPA: glycoside hydrolase family 2 TIM barrel-domain containing protein [Rhizomicrobium sp.]|nr:glycoside hydrolase family 2 TIM barrel-domain containing protein [Rhizomicrobium sp.]
MSGRFTRRGFLGTATTAGVAARLTPALALADPAPRTVPFDDGWQFSRGDFPGAEMPAFADAAWRRVDLPHDWSIEGPYSKDEPSGGSGGYLPTGIGWYRKRFARPAAGKQVEIRFDGVYQRSQVWINGRSLGFRPYGYIGFAYDLTPHLVDGENVVAVRVDNSLQPNSRWYSGSGIYRHVWLTVADPMRIADWGVQVHTTIESGEARLRIATRVVNATPSTQAMTLDTDIVDPNGKIVGTASAGGRVPANGERVFEQIVRVAAPLLWSVETPRLYTARSRLGADFVATAFGIRDARFDADRGFLLNGARVKLNGVCVHGDGGAVGAAVPEAIWRRRLALLKEMGCNAIRCSHNPPAPEFLDLCDTMGFLVMGEPFDEWRQPKAQTPDYGYHRYFDEWGARDLADMIARDRNHPSIVIWSAGNEVPDQTDAKGPETLQTLLDIFHAMDPGRPVTVACDNIAAEPKAALPEFLGKLDVVGYNYVDRWRDRREKFYSIDRHDFPTRKFVGTESPAMGGSRGAYRLGDEPPVFGERPSNSRIEVEQLQKFVQTYDYVGGDFMWTGIDYLGESFWPGKAASSGVLDTSGFPKDGYYFYQSLWTAKTVLHLFPHWNWQGREGETVAVACYTNCDTVELFLNGRSLGTKGFAFPRPGMIKQWGTYPPRALALQTTADLHLAWDVPYAPGVLKAVGTKDGKIVAVVERATTGPAAAIRLSADRDRIDAGRSDLAHVTVEVVDAAGRVVPTAENEIAFTLSGRGRIVGLDNGRPDSHESYRSDRRKAFGGLALALVQASNAGAMLLAASSPGLTPARIEIVAG